MRIGVIGCGGIAQNTHVPTLRSLPDVEIAWLSDLDVDLGDRIARATGIPFVAADIPLVDRPHVDVILLAIPWGARGPIYDALDAFGDDRPGLFIEKPVARTEAEHRRILAPYDDWQVATGLLRRNLPQVGCARALIRSGVFGPLHGAAVRFGGLGRILTHGGYMSQLGMAGGGVLMEMGVHYIDTCLYVIGARDANFRKGKMKTFEGFDLHTEATFDIDLRAEGPTNSAGSATVPLEICITSLAAVPVGIDLQFDRVRVTFDIAGRPILRVHPRDGDCSTFEIAAGPEFGPDQSFAIAGAHWVSFLRGYRSRSANHTSAADALLTTRIVEQAYEYAA